jgi:3-oxoacyl-[acyl-carrier-protein] synthase-1
MSDVFLSYSNIISSLGFDSETVVENISKKVSGLQLVQDIDIFPQPFYTSLIDKKKLKEVFENLHPDSLKYTHLEQMMLVSLQEVIKQSNIELNDRVGLIISTTKGNIDVLENESTFSKSRSYLSELGKIIQDFFNFKNDAIVLSNACVSGILAVAIAKRYIKQGVYDQVFIVSGDIVTPFILSGFNSFQALSDEPCKPYCKKRSGINIGEVAASILVTSKKEDLSTKAVKILGEGSCNDANHISGPSRTGEGLYRSVKSAFREAKINSKEIDFISAHGTATHFNDEMEAIAFNRLGLSEVPLHSLKSYFGHTLGASGLLETIIGIHSLHNNTLYPSLGFEELGVSKPLNIITETEYREIHTFLKTASGFGGCNTAVIFQKNKK